MNDISKEQVWALRGVAARLENIGPLAAVALCDNLLAAWKERDEAQRNLENIKASRASDVSGMQEVIAMVRDVARVPLGVDVVSFVGKMRALFDSAMTAHSQIREAAGVSVGVDIVDHVAVMRNRIGRDEEESKAVRAILEAKPEETTVDAAKRVAEEAEGLYRFKVRIREALGVEKGVDMAEVIRERARVHENWKKDFQCVENRARCLNNTIAEIGKVVGSKDLRAEAVLLHVKSLPTAVTELRNIARNGLGYLPSFLAVGMCEGLADDVLRKKLEARIRGDLDQLRNRPVAVDQHTRDALYKVCEETGILWPGERHSSIEDIVRDIVGAIKDGAGSKHNDTAMRQNLAEKTAALEAAERKARELFERNAEAVSRAESAEKRIKELESNQEANTRRLLTSVWCEALNKQETECWRRSSTETMFVSIVEGVKYQTKRIDELESTIREHEKDLETIGELQDEQTKLNAMLMRTAEGKPVVTVTSKNKSPQVSRFGIRLVLDPNVPRNTWGFLL